MPSRGRITRDDQGLEEGMAGQPGVTELVEMALEIAMTVR